MPHCIIEYARPIEKQIYINDLVIKLHQTMIDSGLFKPVAIKSRAIAFDHYQVGEDNNKAFVHVTVKMLAGRTAQQKKQLSTDLHDILTNMLDDFTSVSVDIRDLDGEAYSK